ncbi:hypothetical protein ACJA3J_05865 [Halobacillus sp. SY10]|uniref:hypothetical protein n=1 Tax=Halobacillus sp. SY10 TaxID=3381356 RepID=UPI0038790353
MPDQKEVEEMKEFMGVLMDVKVSMAELNGKVDKILSLEEKVNNTYDIAKGAERRSKDHEDEIKELKDKKADNDDLERIIKDHGKDISDLKDKKADKGDVERIIKQKDNWQRNLPAWAAVLIAVVSFLSRFISIGG